MAGCKPLLVFAYPRNKMNPLEIVNVLIENGSGITAGLSFIIRRFLSAMVQFIFRFD
jgi:hypothetical protein